MLLKYGLIKMLSEIIMKGVCEKVAKPVGDWTSELH
jgi:hypothetical protein